MAFCSQARTRTIITPYDRRGLLQYAGALRVSDFAGKIGRDTGLFGEVLPPCYSVLNLPENLFRAAPLHRCVPGAGFEIIRFEFAALARVAKPFDRIETLRIAAFPGKPCTYEHIAEIVRQGVGEQTGQAVKAGTRRSTRRSKSGGRRSCSSDEHS